MKKYDLIVVGGGLSGVAASVCAAREGLKVLLIEKEGSLGGAMSNNLVYPFMRFTTSTPAKIVNAGIFEEMKRRHKKYDEESFESAFTDIVAGGRKRFTVSEKNFPTFSAVFLIRKNVCQKDLTNTKVCGIIRVRGRTFVRT